MRTTTEQTIASSTNQVATNLKNLTEQLEDEISTFSKSFRDLCTPNYKNEIEVNIYIEKNKNIKKELDATIFKFLKLIEINKNDNNIDIRNLHRSFINALYFESGVIKKICFFLPVNKEKVKTYKTVAEPLYYKTEALDNKYRHIKKDVRDKKIYKDDFYKHIENIKKEIDSITMEYIKWIKTNNGDTMEDSYVCNEFGYAIGIKNRLLFDLDNLIKY